MRLLGQSETAFIEQVIAGADADFAYDAYGNLVQSAETRWNSSIRSSAGSR